MLDILCVGDAKIDIFLQIPDNDPHFSLDNSKENLQISYGRKISVKDYIKGLGGNACNTAVGISRLGKNVGLCAEIGTDEFSNFVINSLKKENLNTSFLMQDSNKPTSFSVCINYKGERTLLSEHVERDHNFNFETTSANFIYLTSLGNTWQGAYQKVLNFVKMYKIPLGFNPGTLQIESKENLIKELINVSEYLFVNKEEAENILFGKDVGLKEEKKDIKKLLFGLRSMGAKNIIITDSQNGSYLEDNSGNVHHIGIPPHNLVEKTGAGDAYAAGFLSAIIEGLLPSEAMVWGALEAASVVEKIGAENGLLRKNELLEKISSLSNFKAEKI